MADIKVKSFSEDEIDRLKKCYDSIKNGNEYIRTKAGKCFLPAAFAKFGSHFKNWQIKDDDVYVLAFPKNGTTWTTELVWLLMNDCDTEKAKSINSMERIPFLESSMLPPSANGLSLECINEIFCKLEKLGPGRTIKSHLPFCLLPGDILNRSKVVLCLRNPKDVIVSYYFHEINVIYRGFNGDFSTYFSCFMDNLVLYSSYFDYITEVWQRRNHPNLCLLFYEDMKKDLKANVRKVAKFLGKELTDEKVDALVGHLSFKNMRDNKALNHDALKGIFFKKEGEFMRKGEVGDWKNYFTDEMNTRMDEAIEKHFKPIGLEFEYE